MTCRRLGLLISIVLAVGVLGCEPPERDVSADPAFGVFSAIQGRWMTRVPMKLYESHRGTHFLTPIDDADGDTLVAEISAGSSVDIEKLIYRKSMQVSYAEVYGLLSDTNGKRWEVMLPMELFSSSSLAVGSTSQGGGSATQPLVWAVNGAYLSRAP